MDEGRRLKDLQQNGQRNLSLSAVLLDVDFSCTVKYGPTARLAAVEYYGTAIVRFSFRIFIRGGGMQGPL